MDRQLFSHEYTFASRQDERTSLRQEDAQQVSNSYSVGNSEAPSRDRPEVRKRPPAGAPDMSTPGYGGTLQYYTTLPYELTFGYGHILYTYECIRL